MPLSRQRSDYARCYGGVNTPTGKGRGDRPLGDPPKELSAEAKAVWKRDAPYWGTGPDRAMFGRYCRAVADADRFYSVCEKEGWWIKGSRGTLVKHPAARLYQLALDKSDKLAVEFGLSPSSRTRVRVPPKRPAVFLSVLTCAGLRSSAVPPVCPEPDQKRQPTGWATAPAS